MDTPLPPFLFNFVERCPKRRFRRSDRNDDADRQVLASILLCNRHKEARFFHGYYDSYCYLPLYIFAGDHLLCARLRPADQDGAAGAVEEVRRIVEQIRKRWPEVQIIVRADSGFCRDELLSWCEDEHVDYVLGLARNKRLLRRIGSEMWQARRQCK